MGSKMGSGAGRMRVMVCVEATEETGRVAKGTETGSRLSLAIDAIEAYVQRLLPTQPEAQAGLLALGGTEGAQILACPSKDRHRFLRHLSEISPVGSSDLMKGIRLGALVLRYRPSNSMPQPKLTLIVVLSTLLPPQCLEKLPDLANDLATTDAAPVSIHFLLCADAISSAPYLQAFLDKLHPNYPTLIPAQDSCIIIQEPHSSPKDALLNSRLANWLPSIPSREEKAVSGEVELQAQVAASLLKLGLGPGTSRSPIAAVSSDDHSHDYASGTKSPSSNPRHFPQSPAGSAPSSPAGSAPASPSSAHSTYSSTSANTSGTTTSARTTDSEASVTTTGSNTSGRTSGSGSSVNTTDSNTSNRTSGSGSSVTGDESDTTQEETPLTTPTTSNKPPNNTTNPNTPSHPK